MSFLEQSSLQGVPPAPLLDRSEVFLILEPLEVRQDIQETTIGRLTFVLTRGLVGSVMGKAVLRAAGGTTPERRTLSGVLRVDNNEKWVSDPPSGTFELDAEGERWHGAFRR